MTVTVTDVAGNRRTVAKGETVGDVYRSLSSFAPENAVLAQIDNEVVDFQSEIEHDGVIRWLTLDSREGAMAYQRSLILLLVRAVADTYPDVTVRVAHSLGTALYCEWVTPDGRPLSAKELKCVEERMILLRDMEPDIVKSVISRRGCLAYMRAHNMQTDCKILESMDVPEVTYYRTGAVADYYFGPMLPSFAYLKLFALELYAPGFLVRYPADFSATTLPPYKEVPKYAKVFLEAKEWARMLRCSYVSQLNDAIRNGEIEDIVDLAEALQEKRRAQIADYIAAQKPAIRLVLIAGPSSSGKTTFTKRLCTQLRVNNIQPVMISLDDYFVDRDKNPKKPDGSYDFESLRAIDIQFFNEQLLALYAGEEVHLPEFDFITGKRHLRTESVRMTPGSVVVVEGLHALNDELSRVVPRYEKCKIYLGALTQLAINDHNRISTTYARLVRRLVRDYQFRGHGAEGTLAMWENVRQGEEANIFPFQEDADIVFNSALIYELAVLKKLAEPLLMKIGPESPHYHLAHQLIRFLSPFATLDERYVPEKSILREFIG